MIFSFNAVEKMIIYKCNLVNVCEIDAYFLERLYKDLARNMAYRRFHNFL